LWKRWNISSATCHYRGRDGTSFLLPAAIVEEMEHLFCCLPLSWKRWNVSSAPCRYLGRDGTSFLLPAAIEEEMEHLFHDSGR